MKKTLFLLAAIPLFALLTAFCGFYVAKADASLFNQASQVILVRSGEQTVVTMQSDFQGPVKDFAMVIPVPEVPAEKDIRVTRMDVFNKLDGYSGPRLVEYFDESPCEVYFEDSWDDFGADDGFTSEAVPEEEENEKLGVTVEARYSVGEYDILILGAKESAGLETWLIRNGYKIPPGAKEALEPYVKDNLKFFVVKVNLEKHEASGSVELSPIQVTYRTDKFMLPIRLGMANSEGEQDMIVYVLTDQGRAEVTNYRTVEMPTDRDIPTFVENDFGRFYQKTFQRAWERAGKNVALLEYAWDIDGSQAVKCDPCPTPPLAYEDLREAGAFWLSSSGWQGYEGDLFITRLHLRYNRRHFPQDLQFQVTPNESRFQCRYVMHQPALADYSCEEGLPYLEDLITRRKKELKTYSDLTGVLASNATRSYMQDIQDIYRDEVRRRMGKTDKGGFFPALPGGPWPFAGMGLLILALSLLAWRRYIGTRMQPDLGS